MNEDTMPMTSQHSEHCHRCYRLIPPGETHYETGKNTVLCKRCAAAKSLDAIQAADDLAVEIHEHHLTLRRGNESLDVRLDEVRHLVDALVDAAVRLVNYQMHGSLEQPDTPSGEGEAEHTEAQLAALAEVRRILAEATEKWRDSSEYGGSDCDQLA